MELWTIDKPFDILILKYWPEKELQLLIEELSTSSTQPEVAEALSPIGYKKIEYYKDDIVGRIIMNFCKTESLCSKDKYCHDVHRHSAEMKCVTAAAIRWRLSPRFAKLLGVLKNFDFQKKVMKSLNYSSVRNKLGVLLIHCERSSNCASIDTGAHDASTSTSPLLSVSTTKSPYLHALKVLYDNFYLYTAPLNDEYVRHHATEVKQFICNQIFRNSDCIVIMVDDAMIDVFDNNRPMKEVIMESLEWDIRLRIVIIGVSPHSQPLITVIHESMHQRPWLVNYNQFMVAPSGGLVSIIKKACKLDMKSTFMKYIYRTNMALGISFN